MTATTSNSIESRLVGRRLLQLANSTGRYHVRLAETEEDIHAAQTLRFLTFNLEQNHDSADAFATLRDSDPFDAQCDHLIAEDRENGEIVGTYRLQRGLAAQCGLGYYAARCFDLSPLEPFHREIIEIGRACVRRDYRHRNILALLWQALIDYATRHNGRYLIGSSSLATTDYSIGARAHSQLLTHLTRPPFRIKPLPDCACDLSQPTTDLVRLPSLLLGYLSLGAKVCGPPAIDRHFNQAIIFLTVLDLKTMNPLKQ